MNLPAQGYDIAYSFNTDVVRVDLGVSLEGILDLELYLSFTTFLTPSKDRTTRSASAR